MSGFLSNLRAQESGTNDSAQNPRSSALGRYQFINSTWQAFARARPELFQGMNPQQVLDSRRDPALQEHGVRWLRDQNAGALRAAGFAPTDANLGLAHAVGGGGARSVLSADPATPLTSLFGPEVFRANPTWSGQTAGQFLSGFNRRFGGGMTQPEAPATPPQPTWDDLAKPQEPAVDPQMNNDLASMMLAAAYFARRNQR